VTEYLVESYTPIGRQSELPGVIARAEAASAQMRQNGVAVRYIRPILIPEDEVCLHLFEAQSVAAVEEAARRAELPFERIVQASSGQAVGDMIVIAERAEINAG
jgi:hypothetical protein